ncbi:MAG: hypothetical protein BMS9Abin28_0884 [Anaerolineae bacterium]|nr:MAG: hypothetical protein BMS9Abin28_0884 [Anaerolineae bacterium]
MSGTDPDNLQHDTYEIVLQLIELRSTSSNGSDLLRSITTLLHPVLFALFPVVALLGRNIEMIRPAEAIRPTVLIVGAVMLIVLFARVGLKDWGKGALAGTFIIVWSFAFGQIRQLLPIDDSGPEAAPIQLGLFLFWFASIAVVLLLLDRSRVIPPKLHFVLAAAGLAAIAQPFARLVAHEVEARKPFTISSIQETVVPYRPQQAAERRPDVYYLVLDSYGRADVLDEIYEASNRDFLGQLEGRGFLVADESMSNYAQTSLSFASTLNMTYLEEVGQIAGSDSSQREVARLIRFSEVESILRELGYTVMAFSTGYRRAELSNADLFFDARPRQVSPFEALLLESSALWGAVYTPAFFGQEVTFPGYAAYRSRLLANIDALMRSIEITGPKFVFAHLLIPHPPFVLGSSGDPVEPALPFSVADGDQFPGSAADYTTGYRNQVAFANEVVVEFLDILKDSGKPSVVIIQGDHGPGLRLDWADPDRTDKWERHSILNAVRADGLKSSSVDESMSPVNTFRLLFNHLFNAHYPLLQNQSFFSSWRAPYEFIEVPPHPGKDQATSWDLPDWTHSSEGT